jgi:integrase
MVLKYGPVNKDISGNMSEYNLMELDPFLLFNSALRSNQTKEKYQRRLDIFFDFIALPKCSLNERCRIFIENSKKNPTTYPINCVFKFIMYQKERLQNKEIVVSTIYNYLKPIKLLCEMNDIHVKWKKITIGLPKERKYADDRAPTIEEIQKLIEYPDRRIKAIILTMVSSGIRLGSWDDLKYKHIQSIEKDGKIVAAKIIVYAGSDEQYYSFISLEAYQAIDEWVDFRRKSGEKVTDESWLMRNLWDVTTPTGGPRGLISFPKKLKHMGVKSLIERALRAQGIRTKLKEGKKRYDFPTDHGFRKFFKTRCEIAGMKSINIENLMNHSIGVSNSYYRPQENEMLEDYLKAVDSLTLYKNNNNETLEKEIDELREKNENNEHIIKSKLQEKDAALVALSDQVMILMREVRNMKNNDKL